MPQRLTEVGSYSKGVVCRKDKGYLVLTVDEMARDHVPHTVLVLYRGADLVKVTTEPWNTAGIDSLKFDKDQCLLVGEYGHVVVAGAGQLLREEIGTEHRGPRQQGPLRGARVIGGHAYAVGMKGQI